MTSLPRSPNRLGGAPAASAALSPSRSGAQALQSPGLTRLDRVLDLVTEHEAHYREQARRQTSRSQERSFVPPSRFPRRSDAPGASAAREPTSFAFTHRSSGWWRCRSASRRARAPLTQAGTRRGTTRYGRSCAATDKRWRGCSDRRGREMGGQPHSVTEETNSQRHIFCFPCPAARARSCPALSLAAQTPCCTLLPLPGGQLRHGEAAGLRGDARRAEQTRGEDRRPRSGLRSLPRETSK